MTALPLRSPAVSRPGRLTYAAWTAALSAEGFTVLGSSHPVPVQLWLRRGTGPDAEVLHLAARGTRVTLRRYAGSDLATLLLRAECDCAEHRAAGAAARTVLVTGARPRAEAVFDGAAELGWRGYRAGLLDVPGAAALLTRLRAELEE
jgi:hypothetical protein